MIFAGIFDVILDGFLAFSAYVSCQEWTQKERGWQTRLGNESAKKVIFPLTFVANCVVGGLHLSSLAIDLYLLVVYRKISQLPPDLNPLERETLTTLPRRRNRLSDWRVRHSKHLSDATLVNEPTSPIKLNIGAPQSPTKNGVAMTQLPFSNTRQVVRDTSSYYSRPTNSAESPREGQQSTRAHQRVKSKVGRRHNRSRSRPDSAYSEATLRYSGDEDENLQPLHQQEHNPSTTAIYEVPLDAADEDWYHNNNGPELAENSGTVIHHKFGSKSYRNLRPYSQDHVYAYCGLDEEIEEGDEEDGVGEPIEVHMSRTASGVQNAYTQVGTYADHVDYDQGPANAASRAESASLAPHDFTAPSHLSQSQLLRVPYKEDISLPPFEEIDGNYNPLTGSIRTNVSAPRLTLPPNQPRGLTPTSKDRFYSKPEQRTDLEMIVQSPTETTHTFGTPTRDENGEDGAQSKRSFWNLGKKKKSVYSTLNNDDGSDEPAPPLAISGPNGDREGRVVSNSGVERFEGEYLPPCSSRAPGFAADGNGSAANTHTTGPKQRNVSGRKIPDEQQDAAVTEPPQSPSKTRVARELPNPSQYRAAGWARFSGL
ncbi:hypothetical protein AAP_01686 [Ascosphaera apis ARSEF 7405]|uniref:Uncharacterized protein n=1 Tax=Ascosphaera apis ARSEF 7405 TaxID=392613 RepID=A0A168BEE6_9EURO|nr:hypothetical protein AAP_01686 [Ascosphaera apis ARSEF 7405]